MRSHRSLALASLLFAYAPAPAPPPTGAGDRDAFLRGLHRAEELERRGDRDAAERDLGVLLAAHEGELYVLGELPRVDALLDRCALSSRLGPDPLDGALHGELRLERDGEVELVLAFDEHDFATAELDPPPGALHWSGDRWWHPLPFGGPGALRVRGRVPEADNDGAPSTTLFARLTLGLPDSTRTTFELAVGALGEDGLAPVRAFREEPDGTRELLGEADARPLAAGEAYELEVRLSRRRLFLRSRGETVLYVPRPSKVYGRFGWVDLPGLEELVIEGEPDADWLAALPERHREDAVRRLAADPAYARRYPEWLATWLASNPPVMTSPEMHACVERLEGLSVAGEWAQLLEEIDDPLCPPWFADWYALRSLVGLGRNAEALEAADRLLARTPRYEPARRLREQLLGALGVGRLHGFRQRSEWSEGLAFLEGNEAERIEPFLRHWYAHLFLERLDRLAEAEVELDAAHRARPGSFAVDRARGWLSERRARWASAERAYRRAAEGGDDAAQRSLARLLLSLGRHAEAAEIVERARGEPADWEELADLARRARVEPSFAGARRYEGEHFTLVTPLHERHARATLAALDESLAIAAALVGAPDADEAAHAATTCYVFVSPEKYEHYRVAVLEQTEHYTLGVHAAHLARTIVRWRLPADSLRTARHEGTHAALARRFAEVPPWLGEGLACYAERARLAGGGGLAEPDADRLQRVAALLDSGTPWAECAELVRMDGERFYANAEAHYPQALALVAYLVASDDAEARAAWDALVSRLEEGRGSTAIAAALEARLPELDRRVRAYAADQLGR